MNSSYSFVAMRQQPPKIDKPSAARTAIAHSAKLSRCQAYMTSEMVAALHFSHFPHRRLWTACQFSVYATRKNQERLHRVSRREIHDYLRSLRRNKRLSA